MRQQEAAKEAKATNGVVAGIGGLDALCACNANTNVCSLVQDSKSSSNNNTVTNRNKLTNT